MFGSEEVSQKEGVNPLPLSPLPVGWNENWGSAALLDGEEKGGQ